MTDIGTSPEYKSFRDVILSIVRPPLEEASKTIEGGLKDVVNRVQQLDGRVQSDVAAKDDIRGLRRSLGALIGEDDLFGQDDDGAISLSGLVRELSGRMDMVDAAVASAAARVAVTSEQTQLRLVQETGEIDAHVNSLRSEVETMRLRLDTDLKSLSEQLGQLHAEQVEKTDKHNAGQRRLLFVAVYLLVAILAITGLTAWRAVTG